MLKAVQTVCTFSCSECSSKSWPTPYIIEIAKTKWMFWPKNKYNRVDICMRYGQCNRIDLANLLHISVLANSSICYGQYIKWMCPIYFMNFKMGYLGCQPINGFVAADFMYCFGHPNEGSGQWIGMQWQIYACTMANVIEAIWPTALYTMANLVCNIKNMAFSMSANA